MLIQCNIYQYLFSKRQKLSGLKIKGHHQGKSIKKKNGLESHQRNKCGNIFQPSEVLNDRARRARANVMNDLISRVLHKRFERNSLLEITT